MSKLRFVSEGACKIVSKEEKGGNIICSALLMPAEEADELSLPESEIPLMTNKGQQCGWVKGFSTHGDDIWATMEVWKDEFPQLCSGISVGYITDLEIE
jgi:hypothetical protein